MRIISLNPTTTSLIWSEVCRTLWQSTFRLQFNCVLILLLPPPPPPPLVRVFCCCYRFFALLQCSCKFSWLQKKRRRTLLSLFLRSLWQDVTAAADLNSIIPSSLSLSVSSSQILLFLSRFFCSIGSSTFFFLLLWRDPREFSFFSSAIW